MEQPKEKAKELVDKSGVICALICVDEILDAIDWHEFENPNFDYWHEVKQEIEKYEKSTNF